MKPSPHQAKCSEQTFPRRFLIAADHKPEMPRRRFNKLFTVGGLLALAAGLTVFLRARFSGSFAPRIVAQAGEIPVGGSKIFSYPTDAEPCILLRPAPESYIAYSRLCTHASCPVFYNSAADRFDCPCHGGSFSIADGSVLQGPPPRPLPKIVLERRGSDLVAVGLATS
jgi:nitrite reductase/ring-hydroxylating ferredoxin subunit